MFSKPEKSPWGDVQHCETLCPGVFLVSTASHGGTMIAKDISAMLSPAARKCGFKQGDYLCFEEDSQEDVALRELLDKKLWAVPDRIRDKAAFEGRAQLPTGRGKVVGPQGSPPRKLNLIVDIQAKMRAGKGPAYEKWATIYNLKQMATALQYLQENGLLEYGQLEQRAADATDRFHMLSDKIKSIEGAMSSNRELTAATVDYAKARAVFDGYKAAKYSKKYLAEHEADIELYRAAQATFRRILSGGKLPKMDALKAEAQKLAADKNAAYREYRAARKEMQEVITAKHNIDYLLGLTDGRKNKEQER